MMIKIIISILIIMMAITAGCSTGNVVSQQPSEPEVTCIKGFSNDPSPGACGSYIDSDNNRICDLSE
ncbi:MAG: hypothetical protein KKE20_00515 [Nanoarchaeota archaeon]|nr:hypothetical protein [Nanoarchaeota archaeon]